MMITTNQQGEIVEERRNLAIPVVRQMSSLLEEENKGTQSDSTTLTRTSLIRSICDCISRI